MMGGFLSSAMSLCIRCTFITLTLVIKEKQLSVSEPKWWDAPSTEAYGNLTSQQTSKRSRISAGSEVSENGDNVKGESRLQRQK